ncbi:hypothetical protein O181_056244 [Austropuccinia psidii MF-1]|uniref:Uncharacterized protein n=1 Tax=Austropuccinia psidii MF-1 TaxID=1389203 RepID=A0A9Q3E873_9BASI|nr:hypothetical protein [Austropuccinia psidii MF-1]
MVTNRSNLANTYDHHDGLQPQPPTLEPKQIHHTHTQARELIKICGKKGVHLILPKHISTFLGAVDRKQFLETLQQNLGQNADPETSVERTTQDLTAEITEAYNSQGKWVTTNLARSKEWWKKEQLNNLVRLRNKARRNMLKDCTNESQKEYHHHQQLFKQKVWELKSSLSG